MPDDFDLELPNLGDDRPGLDELEDADELVVGGDDDDEDDDYPDDATEDDVDLIVALYREDGQPMVVALDLDLVNDLDALITQLRRIPGDGGALAMVSIATEMFVIVRVRGRHVQVLLSDVVEAADWPLARDVVDYLGLEVPDDDEDSYPVGDLDLLADVGLPDFELEAIASAYDEDTTTLLEQVAKRIKFGPQYTKTVAAAFEVMQDGSWVAVMGEALAQARAASVHGDVPIGAVVLDPGGRVVARAGNERELTGDPTAHAEVLALRRAAEALGSWRLEGCTLVVTLEPCTMCAGALVLARVQRLVFGAFDPKAGAVASLWDVVRDPRLNHRVEVVGGIAAAECAEVLRAFFASQRD